MKDLFGCEKYGDLPKTLSKKSSSKTRYYVGEIGYWSPNKQVAICYRQDGKSIPSPGIIPIAKIDAGAEAFSVPGPVNVIIELAKKKHEKILGGEHSADVATMETLDSRSQ